MARIYKSVIDTPPTRLRMRIIMRTWVSIQNSAHPAHVSRCCAQCDEAMYMYNHVCLHGRDQIPEEQMRGLLLIDLYPNETANLYMYGED